MAGTSGEGITPLACREPRPEEIVLRNLGCYPPLERFAARTADPEEVPIGRHLVRSAREDTTPSVSSHELLEIREHAPAFLHRSGRSMARP